MAKTNSKSKTSSKAKSTYKKSNTPYAKGKRWGYAVSDASLRAGKANIYKVDKAMKTCATNARSGCKKLNQNERDAFRGMADGMYEAIRQSERRSR